MRFYKTACSCLILASTVLLAESKKPADYPLRLHIFGQNQANFYRNREMEEAKGDGRANLYENGSVEGIDFSFDCSQRLKASFGFETYPAKWKKPNRELVVLLPVFGKAGSYFTCDLKTDVKEYAYYGHNGRLDSESKEEYKAWMAKHDYDPEHGKNMPVKTEAQAASSEKAPAAGQQ
jgi:hypothetical protein